MQCIDGFRIQDYRSCLRLMIQLRWGEDIRGVLTMAKNFFEFYDELPSQNFNPQNRDMEAMMLWSGASVVGTFWLTPPWDWLSEQIFGPEDKK